MWSLCYHPCSHVIFITHPCSHVISLLSPTQSYDLTVSGLPVFTIATIFWCGSKAKPGPQGNHNICVVYMSNWCTFGCGRTSWHSGWKNTQTLWWIVTRWQPHHLERSEAHIGVAMECRIFIYLFIYFASCADHWWKSRKLFYGVCDPLCHRRTPWLWAAVFGAKGM